MANEEYIKDTFKPDKLWACPSFTGSSFPGITPPAEGGGGMYQIGEDLNFTLGSYYDYELPEGTVNGDALYNAEYKAGAYVINKGYVFNYIGDSEYYHVFVNVRNTSALPNIGMVQDTAVDIACEILAFVKGTPSNPEGGAICIYTFMPRGTELNSSNPFPSHLNIKINGTEFYSGKYTQEIASPKVYKHVLAYEYDDGTLHLEIECPIYSAKSTAFNSTEAGTRPGLLDIGIVNYGNYKCLLAMRGYVRTSLDQIEFPISTYFATNLATGETFQITNKVRMTFLADIVSEV